MIKDIKKIIIILILLLYTTSYIISETGYYEYNKRQQTIITNDKIKEFEEDVKNNENIDIKNYLNEKEINYSNKVTNLVYNISSYSNDIANKIIKSFFKKIGSFVEE